MLLVCVASIGFSQNLTKLVDEMSGKIYWGDEGLVYLEESAGFRINGKWKYNSSEPIFEGFTVKVAGIGSCVENVQVIVLFEDGQKITKLSWNDFNCDGNAWFHFNKSDLELLRTVPIDKIRLTNGRTYQSITGEVDNSRYFIELYNKSINGVYETVSQ